MARSFRKCHGSSTGKNCAGQSAAGGISLSPNMVFKITDGRVQVRLFSIRGVQTQGEQMLIFLRIPSMEEQQALQYLVALSQFKRLIHTHSSRARLFLCQEIL